MATDLITPDKTAEKGFQPEFFQKQEYALVPPGCTVSFVGEGAANAVFELHLPNNITPSWQQFLTGKLLRVQKVPKENRKPPFSYARLQDHWEKTMNPLFDDDQLVKQHLVWFHGSGIVDILANELQKMELLLRDPNADFPDGSRPKKAREERFSGGKVANFDYGMLVEDMRAADGKPNEVMLEFKAKWLAQSPSAPSNAVRCRNCAITLKRTEEGRTGGIVPACPLSLRLQNLQPRYQHHHELLLTPPKDLYVPIIDWLRSDLILEKLANLQEKFDQKGPLAAKLEDTGFPMAMTLRDCTIFLRIDVMARQVVAAKIGDLDEKNVDAKLDYWKDTERGILDGGYYTKENSGSEACLLLL